MERGLRQCGSQDSTQPPRDFSAMRGNEPRYRHDCAPWAVSPQRVDRCRARESDWISRRRILVDEMAKCGAEPPKTEAAHAECKSRFNRRLLRCDGVKKGCRVADAQESDALDE